ncbi:MAG: 3-deoxy-7-phosphoheptulonate synthase [bacterium]
MLVVMKKNAGQKEIQVVVDKIESMGLKAHVIPGSIRTAIGTTGNTGPIDPGALEVMPGVREVIRVTKPYKLVSREVKQEDTRIQVGNVAIGGTGVVVIAGPCAVESEAQCLAIAEKVRMAGASMYRGGAFKPRTSPYSFQGLGEKGLKILRRVREEFDLPVVTEAVDVESVGLVEQYADVIQVGARNMQHYSLLKRVGRSKRPVLLKRGMSATVEELLMSAEYILSEGNYQVVLCERGVRTFADHTRNTLDLSAVPAVKELSHLPILVDPSHGTGRRDKVFPMALAGLAAGADGLLIEVHTDPEKALSDGPQSLYPAQFTRLMECLRRLSVAMDRSFP